MGMAERRGFGLEWAWVLGWAWFWGWGWALAWDCCTQGISG